MSSIIEKDAIIALASQNYKSNICKQEKVL